MSVAHLVDKNVMSGERRGERRARRGRVEAEPGRWGGAGDGAAICFMLPLFYHMGWENPNIKSPDRSESG